MNDVYKTPDAQLAEAGDDDLDNFERFTAWGVFGISIVTFGMYFVYWFFTRTKVLNGFHKNKISDVVVWGSVLTYIGYIGCSMVPESYYEDGLILMSLGLISLFYFIFYLVWIFTFRSRLLEIAHANGNSSFRLSPALTFFFQSIYLQYKINQYIDAKTV